MNSTDTPPERERAIIYIHAPGEVREWATLCLAHVEARGYELIGLVDDPDGSRFVEVSQMMKEGRVEVVVVGRRSQLPLYRQPRVEEASRRALPPERRRPNIIG